MCLEEKKMAGHQIGEPLAGKGVPRNYVEVMSMMKILSFPEANLWVTVMLVTMFLSMEVSLPISRGVSSQTIQLLPVLKNG